MKSQNSRARKAAYWGAAAGLGLFAMVGLLPSSFIGGVLGLKLAGSLFGGTFEAGLVSRVVVGASMVFGVLVTGLVFVTGSALIAWTTALLATLVHRRHAHETA
ncbi:MAG TPA: hypothetical protein VLH56_12315 [Dissulfurispiraceae bacterium]|nr:hypothetical protein [Dissulfurispiraceae bacterium]